MSVAKALAAVSKVHEENNLRTAREILENPEAWGGEGSGMVNWAHTVVDRHDAASSAVNPMRRNTHAAV